MAAPQVDTRAVSASLRDLQAKVQQNKHALSSTEDNKICEILEQADKLVKNIQKPKEAAIDAAIFADVAGYGLDYVRKLAQGGKSYNVADLLRRLKARYVAADDAQVAGEEDPAAFNWVAAGQAVAFLFRPAPVVHHMLGPLDAQPKARKAAGQRQKRKGPQPADEAVRPDEVQDLDEGNKQETDRNMEIMWNVLRAVGGRAPMLELVMNRESYGQTVENMFALSFLVRDSRVEEELDEKGGIIVVQHHKKKEAAGGRDRGNEPDRDWEEWKRSLDPNTPDMMPHREDRHEQQQRDEEEEEEEEEEAVEPRGRGRGRQQEQQCEQQRGQRRLQRQQAGGGEEVEAAEERPQRSAKRSRR
eukprot:scaffold6.g2822.t1